MNNELKIDITKYLLECYTCAEYIYGGICAKLRDYLSYKKGSKNYLNGLYNFLCKHKIAKEHIEYLDIYEFNIGLEKLTSKENEALAKERTKKGFLTKRTLNQHYWFDFFDVKARITLLEDYLKYLEENNE